MHESNIMNYLMSYSLAISYLIFGVEINVFLIFNLTGHLFGCLTCRGWTLRSSQGSRLAHICTRYKTNVISVKGQMDLKMH